MKDVCLIGFLAVATMLSVWILRRGEIGKRLSNGRSFSLALAHTLAGVFCVSVFASLENLLEGGNGNMSLFGAIFFLPFFYYVAGKLGAVPWKTEEIFDRGACCIVGTLMIVRVNCIVSSCCMGMPIGTTQWRWPTRELEVLFWFLLLLYLLHKEKRDRSGRLYPLLMMGYGVFRFLEEFLREGDCMVGVFHIAHLWAILSFLLGSTIYFILIDRNIYDKRLRKS